MHWNRIKLQAFLNKPRTFLILATLQLIALNDIQVSVLFVPLKYLVYILNPTFLVHDLLLDIIRCIWLENKSGSIIREWTQIW